MTKINPNMASILAQNLDAKDGKQDGKISASVWNEFVADKGGKTIKYSITVENATKSISTYLSRNSQSTGKSKENLFADWFSQDLSVDKARKEKIEHPHGLKETTFTEEEKQLHREHDICKDYINGKTAYLDANNIKSDPVKLYRSFDSHIPGFGENEIKNLTLENIAKTGDCQGINVLFMLYDKLLEQANSLGIKHSFKPRTELPDVSSRLKASQAVEQYENYCNQLCKLIEQNKSTLNYPC